MTEAEEFLEKRRKSEIGRTLLQSITIIGLFSLAVAVVILFVRDSKEDAAITVFVERAQASLKATCEEVDLASLPRTAQQDCQAAAANKLPEKLQQEVDDADPNDPEQQDLENQDPEIQESETQDPEAQDAETQDPELPDQEENDPDAVDDPDPNDPEIQDPEIDDPSIPGPQGPQGAQGEPGPNCPPGYTAAERFVEGNPMTTEDDQTWLVCVKD